MKNTNTQQRVSPKGNIKPYLVVGVGFLVVIVSIYQVAVGARGSLIDQERSFKKEVASSEGEDDTQKIKELKNVDSDSDGLLDIEEEQIYKTDPTLPDTDGDGFSDGVEIDNGFDPRVNERGITQQHSQNRDDQYYDYNRFIANSPDAIDQLNSSEGLSEEDYQNLFNGDGSTESIDDVAALALSNASIQDEEAIPLVDDSEIIITEGGGREAIERYLFAAGSLFFKLAPVTGQDQAVEYTIAAMNGDQEKMRESVRVAELGLRDFKGIPVPTEMVSLHKRAIGVLETFIDSTNKILDKEGTEPQQGIQAVNNIRVLANAVNDMVHEMFGVTAKYGINLNSLLL